MSKIYVDSTTGEILENVVELRSQDKQKPRGRMVKVTCSAPGCINQKDVRPADLARGWGKFCSKSCAMKGRNHD
ncbi:hypothetical protein AAS23_gp63 [Pantoea phage vB_PagS_AAS23]|uniref:Uncharacterized protein n=1 Tax=Pantoea phage vB_PagS_AAS23 TaxID=2499073 RepID=A0A3S9U7V5_9CAUD|nr:hypothetical protein HOU93_gp63 [Pantoea phage vB_PagS_AAS23]AZS06376.1 hypothetical protein AAS23_gp63 [Pantoea phage vB_PagS_AAS23]